MWHEKTLILGVPAQGALLGVAFPPPGDSRARLGGHGGDGTALPTSPVAPGARRRERPPVTGVSSSPCPVPSGTGGQPGGPQIPALG